MKQIILIDYDCIMDSRLGFLNYYHSEQALEIFKSDEALLKFTDRIGDEFKEYGYQEGEFRERYRKRDNTFIQKALPTAFCFELKHFVGKMIDMMVLQPHRLSEIEIQINLYPYVFDEEQADFIAGIILRYIDHLVKIKTVYIPPTEFTPHLIKTSDYSALFIYDFEQWVAHHYNPMVQDCDEIRNPSFTIYTPSNFVNSEKLREAVEFKNPKGETANPIEGIQMMFKHWFNLELMDMAAFSLGAPSKAAQYFLDK